jgi:hypothetical protein
MKIQFSLRIYLTLALLSVMTLRSAADFLSPQLPARAAAPKALAVPVPGTNVWTVTSDDDSGPGTLRQAIADAASGDTIRFALRRYKHFNFHAPEIISLKSTLVIDKDLNIVGPGPAKLIVARSSKKKTPAFRVFDVNDGTVAISGITIANGRALNPDGASDNLGGGILNFGSLTISNCVLIFNEARTENGGVGYGGGIFSVGALTVIDSTLTQNKVSGAGGGISTFHTPDFLLERSTVSENFAAVQAGGVNFQGTIGQLRNSTISGNTTSPQGAASGLLHIVFPGEVAGLDISACTIAQNKGGTNAIVFAALPGSFGLVARMIGTIAAQNDSQNFALLGAPIFQSLGNNLDTDGTSGIANGVNGDLAGTLAAPIDARLGPLANNGGPTRTHALLFGSPAVDAGACEDTSGQPLATDQRGVARPQGATCDIGAFENQAPTVTCPAPSTLDCGDELRVTVNDPDGDALSLVWAVDGTDVQTNFLAAAHPSAVRAVKLRIALAAGPHALEVRLSDGKAAPVTCATSITVQDTKAPKIKQIKASPGNLWPATNQFVPVTLSVKVEDCSPTTCRIIAVRSSESVGAEPDWIITGDLTVDLRAERNGKKGRTYTVTVECTDSAGLKSRDTVTVKVTKNRPSSDDDDHHSNHSSHSDRSSHSGTTDHDDDDDSDPAAR